MHSTKRLRATAAVFLPGRAQRVRSTWSGWIAIFPPDMLYYIEWKHRPTEDGRGGFHGGISGAQRQTQPDSRLRGPSTRADGPPHHVSGGRPGGAHGSAQALGRAVRRPAGGGRGRHRALFSGQGVQSAGGRRGRGPLSHQAGRGPDPLGAGRGDRPVSRQRPFPGPGGELCRRVRADRPRICPRHPWHRRRRRVYERRSL